MVRRGAVALVGPTRRLHRREGRAGALGDEARVPERLEVHTVGALHLDVPTEPSTRRHRLEGDRRDLAAVLDLHRLGVERHEADRVRGHVDEPRELAAAIAEHLPVGVACRLEVLLGAAMQVGE